MRKQIVTDPARLAAHVRALAVAHDVMLVEEALMPLDQATAVCGLQLVLTSPVVDDTSYAKALHEMGHLLAPLGNLGREVKRAATNQRAMALTLESELAAWEWAEHNALDWTTGMEQVKLWSLSTYTERQKHYDQREADAKTFLKHGFDW